jgi:hypothetical protein
VLPFKENGVYTYQKIRYFQLVQRLGISAGCAKDLVWVILDGCALVALSEFVRISTDSKAI